MSHAVDQITAPVPFRALPVHRFKRAIVEEQQVPTGHKPPDVEGEGKVVLERLTAHCRNRPQISIHCRNIGIGHLREIGIGERGVEVRAFAVNALAHGTGECLFAPGANARLAVRGDVYRENSAEGGRHGTATCIGFATLGGVATLTVAELGQVIPTRDLGLVCNLYVAIADFSQLRLPNEHQCGDCHKYN